MGFRRVTNVESSLIIHVPVHVCAALAPDASVLSHYLIFSPDSTAHPGDNDGQVSSNPLNDAHSASRCGLVELLQLREVFSDVVFIAGAPALRIDFAVVHQRPVALLL